MILRNLIHNLRIVRTANQSMSFFKDKLMLRKQKQQDEQFKKEMEALANKPSFTLMDYRQRVVDQMNKLRKNLAQKLSKNNAEQQQELQLQSNILNGLFDEELNGQKVIDGSAKSEIALVAQVDIAKVNDLFKKFEVQQKVHAFLRKLKKDGEPLPNDQEQLKRMYMNSGAEFQDRKMALKKKSMRRSRAQRARMIKFDRL